MKRIELTGQRFGQWSVLDYSHRAPNGALYWLCACSCGRTENPVSSQHLRNGASTRCSKCIEDNDYRRKDLTGQRFGSWLVLRIGARSVTGAIHWKCKCDCGAVHGVLASNLVGGYSSRCSSCAARLRHKNRFPEKREGRP